MEDKREMTLEELEAKYEKMTEEYKVIENQIKKKKREEEDKRKAELTARKDARYKEIEEASKHLSQLIKDYTKDYGSFSFKRNYSSDNDDRDFPYLWHWFL